MYEKILKISDSINSKFILNYNISQSTWFRTGGNTDIYCLVNDYKDLQINLNNIGDVPFYIIGAGSNLLIRDGGFKGLIIKLGKSFNILSIENDKIIAGGSILDMNLSKFAFSKSIKNFEFFSSIPGSIGGAVKMNAGCFGSETKDILHSVTVMKKNGNKALIKNDELEFVYRNSNLKDDIVLKA